MQVEGQRSLNRIFILCLYRKLNLLKKQDEWGKLSILIVNNIVNILLLFQRVKIKNKILDIKQKRRWVREFGFNIFNDLNYYFQILRIYVSNFKDSFEEFFFLWVFFIFLLLFGFQ